MVDRRQHAGLRPPQACLSRWRTPTGGFKQPTGQSSGTIAEPSFRPRSAFLVTLTPIAGIFVHLFNSDRAAFPIGPVPPAITI
jgi:hypothetical protein